MSVRLIKRERVMRAVRFQETDRVPVYDIFENDAVICRQTIRDAGGRGYSLGSLTELHGNVKLENAIAMLETAWEGLK